MKIFKNLEDSNDTSDSIIIDNEISTSKIDYSNNKYIVNSNNIINSDLVYANEKYVIVVRKNNIEVFKYPNLDNTIQIIKCEGCFFLGTQWLFLSRGSIVWTIDLENGRETQVVKLGTKVTSIFCIGSFLYVGDEAGVVENHIFDGTRSRRVSRYKHGIPVKDLVGRGKEVYVVDFRNKITEYPGEQTYYFNNPKIYYGKYLFCTEGGHVYAKTKEAFGLFTELKTTVTRVYFCESNEYVFLEHSGGTICMNMFGEVVDEYAAVGGVFCHNELLWRESELFRRQELYLPTTGNNTITFRPVEIKEKKVKLEEDEATNSSIYIRNRGRSTVKNNQSIIKNSDNTIDTIRDNSTRDSTTRDNSTRDNSTRDNSTRDNSTRDSTTRDSTTRDNSTRDSTTRDSTTRDGVRDGVRNNINDKYSFHNSNKISTVAFSPTACAISEVALMHYSIEGFMTSIFSADVNFVSVRFHDNRHLPLEIKDDLKASIGCFCGSRFILSNGSVINFNNEWRKDEIARLVGLNSSFIFILNENLRLFDFSGQLVHEIFAFGCYTFCCSEKYAALFFLNQLLLIELTVFKGEYIPLIGHISFCCFSNDLLYIQITDIFYVLRNNLFFKICNLKARPLAVVNNCILTLSEPIVLLPRPVIEYNKIESSNIETKESLLQ